MFYAAKYNQETTPVKQMAISEEDASPRNESLTSLRALDYLSSVRRLSGGCVTLITPLRNDSDERGYFEWVCAANRFRFT